jgi:pSer/pThr/pTyr-binding forkhead associated (FHA) protein
VLLQDSNASRRHAEIRVVDGRHQLTDLKSTNGTRVNGMPIGQHTLSYGDLITVGGITLRYEAS